MLPVSARLTAPQDFARTTKSGLRVTTEHFVGYLHVQSAITNPYTQEVLNGFTPQPRAGLIIGKNVGGSVRRHRISRQIRHALAPILKDFPAGSLIVIRGLKQSDAVDVQQEISEIATRLIERAAKRTANAS